MCKRCRKRCRKWIPLRFGPYGESLDFFELFQKYTPRGVSPKSILRLPTGSRGMSMPNLVGIHPVVLARNPNKQTNRQTDRRTDSQTGLLYISRWLYVQDSRYSSRWARCTRSTTTSIHPPQRESSPRSRSKRKGWEENIRSCLVHLEPNFMIYSPKNPLTFCLLSSRFIWLPYTAHVVPR